jgi:hypothetical protein
MIGQIIGAIGGLATSYLDGKTAIQKANAEIKLKQATGEMGAVSHRGQQRQLER